MRLFTTQEVQQCLYSSILAPHTCVSCGYEGCLLCSNCSGGLRRAIARCYRCHKVSEASKTCQNCRRQTKLTRVRAFTTYEQSAKYLAWRLKFERAKAGTAEIGRLLAPLLGEHDHSENLILVHVPTATSRVRRRYDQAALIVRTLACEIGLLRAFLLARVGQ